VCSSDLGYALNQVLDLTSITLNEGAVQAMDDDAVQLVAYFGDATGNGGYSSLDTSRVSRVAVGLDTGLSAFPRIDPVLVADITGNGAISSLDTSRVSRVAVGLPVAEVPAMPGFAPMMVASDLQPKISDSVDSSAKSEGATVVSLDVSAPMTGDPSPSEPSALSTIGLMLAGLSPPRGMPIPLFTISANEDPISLYSFRSGNLPPAVAEIVFGDEVWPLTQLEDQSETNDQDGILGQVALDDPLMTNRLTLNDSSELARQDET
jgi:hypothetical protein